MMAKVATGDGDSHEFKVPGSKFKVPNSDLEL
jgi:hypothetical protein